MNTVKTLLEIMGALGLFLYGMKVMSDGIQKASGERLQSIMNHLTSNRVIAVITGFAITAMVQSSSATTVMVVSFVNAGLLSLVQSIGVIMGANIGTTVTGWIISLIGFKINISAMALPAVGFGLILYFSKNDTRQNWGEFLIGFGLLFLGLDFLKESVPTVEAEMISFLGRYTDKGMLSILLFIVAGAVLTVIVHSSSASMAIVLTMAHNGIIDLPIATAMILGGNIGTTIDAFLVSIKTSVNARRAARVHILFNVIGVLIVFPFFFPFLKMVQFFVPVREITIVLAAAHTIFNVLNTLLFLPFVNQMAHFVEKLIKARPEDLGKGIYQLKYMSGTIQDTAEINVLRARREILHMAENVSRMFNEYLDISLLPAKKVDSRVVEIKAMEDYTDQMREEIRKFLIACSRENISDHSRDQVNAFIRIVNELESIADSIYNLTLILRQKARKKVKLHDTADDELTPYMAQVQKFLDFIKDHLNHHLSDEATEKAYAFEREINKTRDQLKKKARQNLVKGADVKGELIFIDTIRHLEHVGDYCLNIAQALTTI